jgi:tellurite resistance protein TehA-like permease
MTHFYGAAPMALMTVGSGALLIGKDLIGERIAVDLAWVLWTAGTVGGLFTAATIPFLMFTQLHVEPDAAFGGWLMPVVPPMVSAAAGALLIPHMAPGTGRTTMLYGCYAMFGLSLVAALIIISMIWSRLALYGTSGTTRVPTLWIVLGPLGQGITAAGLLGANAALAVPPEMASGMTVFAVLFGVPVWGFAVLWIVLATELTVRTPAARDAVRADLVEPDLPGGHVRHGHHSAGEPHRAARLPDRRRPRLPRPDGDMGIGRGADRARQPGRRPVHSASGRWTHQGQKGSTAKPLVGGGKS